MRQLIHMRLEKSVLHLAGRTRFRLPRTITRFDSSSSSSSSTDATSDGSSSGNGDGTDSQPNTQNNEKNHQQQEFVRVRLEPGEWDAHMTNPLTRPPWRSNARIMSADDFAARPRTGFSEEFESMSDAMVTLSWMDSKQTDQIYQAYLEMMTQMKSSESGTTSHEYVIHVLAQKYSIIPARVSAIVRLGHNEEQLKKEGRPLYNHLQDYVDSKVQEHIDNAYNEYQETKPNEFVEDPLGVSGLRREDKGDSERIAVDDLIDLDALEREADQRTKDLARHMLDHKIYKEDFDENDRLVKLSSDSKKLLERQKSMHTVEESQRPGELKPMPGDDQERRTRWKYVAKTINTREERKARSRTDASGAVRPSGRKAKQRAAARRLDDTLVEQDGLLRAATLREAQSSSWKSKRNVSEFVMKEVKEAWLDRTLRGEQGGWGRQEAPKVIDDHKESEEQGEPQGAEAEETDAELLSADSTTSSADSSAELPESSQSGGNEEMAANEEQVSGGPGLNDSTELTVSDQSMPQGENGIDQREEITVTSDDQSKDLSSDDPVDPMNASNNASDSDKEVGKEETTEGVDGTGGEK